MGQEQRVVKSGSPGPGQRYFFRIADGQGFSLPLAIELRDIREARREAVKLVCEKMSDDSEGFWRTREWQLTVTDERGLNVFSLLVLASDAPAASGR